MLLGVQGEVDTVVVCDNLAIVAIAYKWVTGELLSVYAKPQQAWDNQGCVSARGHVLPNGERMRAGGGVLAACICVYIHVLQYNASINTPNAGAPATPVHRPQ